MKFLLISALCLLPLSLAHSDDAAPAATLVEVAQADPRFSTLVTAIQAAGLVDTLQNGGPFTVFAPTNEAFAAVPEAALRNLLLPANRSALTRVLLNHVVAGSVRSSDLLKTTTATTLAQLAAPIGLRIGNANVITADIECSNGVIHIIDQVLLPAPAKVAVSQSTPRPTTASGPVNFEHVIAQAIEKGVPLFNDGDHDACVRVYANAAQQIVSSPSATTLMRMRLQRALDGNGSATDKAWALRDAMDQVVLDHGFTPSLEASMPPGFPAPGAVGEVILKRYPVYRAAQADGGNAAFWTLFQHIKSNDVEMTAPVEMTMSDDMREQAMAFLYERPDQGSTGAQGKVQVVDTPARQVVSIGMRGSRSAASLKMARQLVEAYLTQGGWKAAGSWRVLGYNSPMVPAQRRYWELQVPVAR